MASATITYTATTTKEENVFLKIMSVATTRHKLTAAHCTGGFGPQLQKIKPLNEQDSPIFEADLRRHFGTQNRHLHFNHRLIRFF